MNASRPDPVSLPQLIAFYLPQFHPIPENDRWWGPGFTEWQNVVRAKPLFRGHYQPHLPADLGFYDLRVPETRQAQATLARQYGVNGFCYYHYWFSGKRLLERPFEDVLHRGEPDFPFCLCWANETWSRRWSGEEQQILQKQTYSREDDLNHIRYLLPAFRDSRYIAINGKPLFLIYRANNLPSARETTDLWREEALRAGLPGLYLCAVYSDGVAGSDPQNYGCDAAVEFQPDWRDLPPIYWITNRHRLRVWRNHAEFEHDVIPVRSYRTLAEKMMARPEWPYKVMPGVTPGWDNTARRGRDGFIFVDSSPELYQQWVVSALARADRGLAGDERIVFINAWNEWAEGAHLEPDAHHGHAFLQATRDALAQYASLSGHPRGDT